MKLSQVILLGSVVITGLTGCGTRSYHEYALTNTFNGSAQKEHLQALKTSGDSGIDRRAHACIYYPTGLGSFSTGCGVIQYSPYQIARR